MPVAMGYYASGSRTKAWTSKIPPGKQFPVDEALKLVKEFATAKFNETVELSMLLGVDPTTGLPIFDFDNPAIKFSSFTVVPVETGTPSNPGAINCAKGILATTT